MRSLIAIIIVVLIAILGALYLSGCGCESQGQAKTTSFPAPASAKGTPGPILAEEGSGSEVRVIFITSNKFAFHAQAREVRTELERILNSGEYDIITVRTFYTVGCLISAEVWYRVQQE